MALSLLPADSFDLEKYLGSWYQFAATHQSYQPSGSYNVQANYERVGDRVRVVNMLSFHGKTKRVQGTLFSNSTNPRKFRIHLEKVILWWGVTADYVVKEVLTRNGEYQFALVGNNDEDIFYLLSRTKVVGCEDQARLREVVEQAGYHWDRLEFTAQIC